MLVWFRKVVSDKFESQIRASSIRRQQFSQIVKTFTGKDLQLLRDVDTRWSSALLMIERALILEEVSPGVTHNLCYQVNFVIWICSASSLS